MSILHVVQQKVSNHMDSILSNFKSGAKITVIVRIPDEPEQDFMLTNDNPVQAIELIQRRIDAEGKVKP